MILFNGGSNDPGNANSVTAHIQRLIAAVGIKVGRIQRLAVLGAQLKHVAYLDSPAYLDFFFGIDWARIATDGLANILGCRLRQVAPPVDAGKVNIVAIGTADKICEHARTVIDNHRDFQAHRPN